MKMNMALRKKIKNSMTEKKAKGTNLQAMLILMALLKKRSKKMKHRSKTKLQT
jgi:hypothetical protein